MDKVEKIKAYIEKRKKENILTSEAKFEEDVDILSAINSLPVEPVSEDLEEATERYASRYANSKYGYDKIGDAFKAGANWQKEKMMKDAIEGEVVATSDWWESVRIYSNRQLCLEDKIKIIVVKEE